MLRLLNLQIIFLSSGRKMTFRGPYRGREILNVKQCNTFRISRLPYGTRKFILRPPYKNSTLYTKDAKCIILGECDLWGRAERSRQRSHLKECYRCKHIQDDAYRSYVCLLDNNCRITETNRIAHLPQIFLSISVTTRKYTTLIDY